MNSSEIFNFLRGALRGHYGKEELRGKQILIVGMGPDAQDLLMRICVDGVDLFFSDPSIRNNYRAHLICGPANPYNGEPVDIIVDFIQGKFSLKGKDFPLSNLKPDAYTQGIHEFYLPWDIIRRENESGNQSDLGSPTEAGISRGNGRNS